MFVKHYSMIKKYVKEGLSLLEIQNDSGIVPQKTLNTIIEYNKSNPEIFTNEIVSKYKVEMDEICKNRDEKEHKRIMKNSMKKKGNDYSEMDEKIRRLLDENLSFQDIAYELNIKSKTILSSMKFRDDIFTPEEIKKACEYYKKNANYFYKKRYDELVYFLVKGAGIEGAPALQELMGYRRGNSLSKLVINADDELGILKSINF